MPINIKKIFSRLVLKGAVLRMEKGLWKSWNGNIHHEYSALYKPSTESEIATLVRESASIRVVGAGCSSADIAAGTETLLSLENYKNIRAFHDDTFTVTVECGILLKELLVAVSAKGWSFACRPDIDAITLGGALATGTHGTGKNGKMLADSIVACRMVTADGSIIAMTSADPRMDAVRLSIGLLGIMTEVTLQCENKFILAVTEKPVSDDDWFPRYTESVRFYDFYRLLWLPHTGFAYEISGERMDAKKHFRVQRGPWHHKYRRDFTRIFYRIALFYPPLTKIANRILKTLFFSSVIRKTGALYDVSVTKSRGSTLELAEWTIPLERFGALFVDLKKELDKKDNKAFIHIPMDIRFIRADATWLSYAYEADTVTMGCVLRNASAADDYKAFEVVEKIFLRHGGKPHWAKRFAAKADTLSGCYPRWDDFITLRRGMDPSGKFLNTYLKEIFK